MKLLKMFMLALVIAAPTAQANLVSNGGFEQPGTLAVAPGYQYLPNGDTTVTGWTTIDDLIGEQSYLMNKNRTNNSYLTRVFQDTYGLALNTGNAIQTSLALVAGTTYDLSFYAKANVATAAALEVSLGGFTTSFANTLAFAHFQYQFTAGTTEPAAVLKFFNPSASGGNRIWNLDEVSVVAAPVPAPAAVWTFLTGLMGLLALERRKLKIA